MPYIIITKSNVIGDATRRTAPIYSMDVTRTAVATLDEAREAAKTTIIDGPNRCGVDDHIIATYHLPAEGGTIGPLPDGTVIEVRRVGYPDLQGRVGPWIGRETEIIAAFNRKG